MEGIAGPVSQPQTKRQYRTAAERRRIYTVSEKSFLHATGSYGMWVGAEFEDSGLTMVVTKIGHAYRWGNKKSIDTEALVKESIDGTTLPVPK